VDTSRTVVTPRLGRQFWRIFAAYSISTLGDEIYALAVPLVLLASGFGASVATFLFGVIMCSTVASGFLIGFLVDRVPTRVLMSMSYSASAAFLGCSAVAVLLGVDSLLVALVAASFLGIFSAASSAAVDAGVARAVVDARARRRGYSLVESSRTAAAIVGPPLGGLIASLKNLVPVLVVNALSFVVAVLLLGRRHDALQDDPSVERCPLLQELSKSLAAVRDNSSLRVGIGLSLIVNVTLGAEQPLLLARLVRDLKASTLAAALVVTGAGLFSIGAALLLARLRSGGSARSVMFWSSVASATAAVGLAFTRHLLVAAAIYCLMLAGNTIYNVTWRSYRQDVVPHELLGRVSASCRSLAYIGVVVGVAITGVLQLLGAGPAALLGGGGALCLGALSVWRLTTSKLSAVPVA